MTYLLEVEHLLQSIGLMGKANDGYIAGFTFRRPE